MTAHPRWWDHLDDWIADRFGGSILELPIRLALFGPIVILETVRFLAWDLWKDEV